MNPLTFVNAINKPFNEPPVQAAYSLLQLLNAKVTAGSINDELQNHPDYPSLLSLSDALFKWNIQNVAFKAEKTDLETLPVPFITCKKYGSRFFEVVSSVNNNTIRYIDEHGRKVSADKENFLKNWNGIVLLAEANAYSGEKDYNQKRKAEIRRMALMPAIFAVLLMLSAYSVVYAAHFYSGLYVTGFAMLLLLKFAGIAITVLLLWYEVDKTNPSLQKICTGGAKINCNAILSSRQAKIFKGLSWSEVGFFYFTGGFLYLVLSGVSSQVSGGYPVNLTNSINPVNPLTFLTLLNLLSLPYIIFSVYYQWRIAKQWCVLCLCVQAILPAEFITACTMGLLRPFSHLTIEQLQQFFRPQSLLIFFLPAAAWFIIKPALHKAAEAKTIKRDLNRLKFNMQIFRSLMERQKKVKRSPLGLGIIIGNCNAAHTIIKVCNPYCGPCAKAHPEIEALLHENKNIQVQIIFTATADDNDSRGKPVKHLLAIASQQDETLTRQALDDWYLADKKEYDAFARKYPLNENMLAESSIINNISLMHEWCETEGIEFTPTIFIDGTQMPDVYAVSDLKYFLKE